jgi:hypothetical protein
VPGRIGRAARARGLTAAYLPIVLTPKWEWRGFFDPDDVEGWFRSYLEWMRGLARESRELGLSELVAGTEFVKLYRHEERWRSLVRDLRAEFAGPIVLTANWDDFGQGFWDEVDAIGVSAYNPLKGKDAPSQDDLDAAWRRLRESYLKLARRHHRPLHVTEVGYTSSTSAARTPWSIEEGAGVDPALQARCFEAFRRAWSSERELVRTAVWATSDAGQPGYAIGFETLGKPAEGVLWTFFSERFRLAP